MSKKNIVAMVVVAIILVTVIVGVAGMEKEGKEASNFIANTNTGNEVINTNTDFSVEYSSNELTGEYTSYTAKIDLDKMSIEEGGGLYISDTTVYISNAGVYYFTGIAKEGNIEVNADNQEVILVLDNVQMTCSTTAVINVVDAKKVTINIPEGTTSTLTDSSSYTKLTEDDEPNATIFSKDDLSIDGKGTLIVNANYEDAIASKDGLKIVNVALEVNAKDDAIRGKDYLAIKEANITITCKGKALKVTEDTDTSKGYLVIDGGNYTIRSEDDALHSGNSVVINSGKFDIETGDDGIHADNKIVINGGNVTIAKSYEGMEATYIEINGGDVSVTATDDGINICGGNDNMGFMKQDAFRSTSSDDTNRMLVINGGTLYVESNGDGLDSNGSIQMNGGTVVVGGSTNGGNSALDYDQSFMISGGTLIAYGPTGMWQNPSNSSTQYSMAFAVNGKAGDAVELKDSKGNTIANFTTKRAYGMVCISTSTLAQGETYTLYINDAESGSQELTSIVTTNGQSNGMFGGKGQGRSFGGNRQEFPMNGEQPESFNSEDMPDNPMNKGEMPDFENGERPEMPNGENFNAPRERGDRQEGMNMNGEKGRNKKEMNQAPTDNANSNVI